MGQIKTVSDFLKLAVDMIQTLREFDDFALGGGTNLALRFDHRESVDIDLFTNKVIEEDEQVKIRAKILEVFKEYFPTFKRNEPSSQIELVLKAFLVQGDDVLKFDFIQNTPLIYPIEIVNGVKMLSVKEIALMKIDSIVNRNTYKDIYDLNYITDHIISLPNLWNLYWTKKTTRFKNKNALLKMLLATKREHIFPDIKAPYLIQEGLPSMENALKNWGYKLDDLNLDLNEGISHSFF